MFLNTVKAAFLCSIGISGVGRDGPVQRVPGQEDVAGADQGAAERPPVARVSAHLHRRAHGVRARDEEQVKKSLSCCS